MAAGELSRVVRVCSEGYSKQASSKQGRVCESQAETHTSVAGPGQLFSDALRVLISAQQNTLMQTAFLASGDAEEYNDLFGF